MRSIAAIMLIAAASAAKVGDDAIVLPAGDGFDAASYDNKLALDAVKYDDDAANEIREVVTIDERDSAYDGDGEGDFVLLDTELLGDQLGWFNEISGLPFFAANKAKIWDDAVSDLPALLDVCPPGVVCRDESRTALVTKLTAQWKAVIDAFRLDVLGEIDITKTEIKATHAEFVQCQIDDHCCDTTDSVIINWWIEINNFTEQKNLLIKEKTVLGYKIMEVQAECPQYNDSFTFPTVA